MRKMLLRTWERMFSDFKRDRRKYIKALIFLSLVCAVFLYRYAFVIVADQLDSMKLYEGLREDINDPGQLCQLPSYHPFERDVLHHFRIPRPISCRSTIPPLTFIDEQGFLRYNTSAFEESGYSMDGLNCYYQEINRIKNSDEKIAYSAKKPITGRDKPKTDFVYVACRKYSWLPNVYSMFHAFAQKKDTSRRFRDDAEVGVAVIGFDSVSRLNFMRQLPKSYHYITNDMNGVVLKGFNKVGENTFPNLIAMLTGNIPPTDQPKSTFDDWPLLWNALKADGVATFYGEDCSSIMTFSWQGKGFLSDPTTHYFRPFWLAADFSSLAAWSSPMCLGSVPKHRIYLDYLKSFLISYRQHPIFMFSLENEPSHDYMNTVGVIDTDLRNFLSSAFRENLFNRTVLFVLSDHGHRFDDFRKTKQGRVEDRMPMVSVVLPEWYSQRYPHISAALRTNSGRLTSSFDLYSTFVDVFQRNAAPDTGARYRFNSHVRGRSLFEPVPLNRTCEEAGIPEMYCTCKEKINGLAKDEQIAAASIAVLSNYINNEVLNWRSRTWNETIRNYLTSRGAGRRFLPLDLSQIEKCAKLTLEIEESELVVKPDGRRLVHLTFASHPNEGLFEGRVLWPAGSDTSEGTVHEDIIRINRYGDQADCLQHVLMTLMPIIRSVCYCK